MFMEEMLETELGEVFGTPDSIKSIRLNAFDEDMNLVENFMFNDSIIRLSKNYGLLTDLISSFFQICMSITLANRASFIVYTE